MWSLSGVHPRSNLSRLLFSKWSKSCFQFDLRELYFEAGSCESTNEPGVLGKYAVYTTLFSAQCTLSLVFHKLLWCFTTARRLLAHAKIFFHTPYVTRTTHFPPRESCSEFHSQETRLAARIFLFALESWFLQTVSFECLMFRNIRPPNSKVRFFIAEDISSQNKYPFPIQPLRNRVPTIVACFIAYVERILCFFKLILLGTWKYSPCINFPRTTLSGNTNSLLQLESCPPVFSPLLRCFPTTKLLLSILTLSHSLPCIFLREANQFRWEKMCPRTTHLPAKESSSEFHLSRNSTDRILTRVWDWSLVSSEVLFDVCCF